MTHLLYILLAAAALYSCQPPRGTRPLIGGANGTAERADGGAASPHPAADTMALPAPLTDRPEQILHRMAYTVSYNRETLLPNWVAWHLTADHTTGPYKRGGIPFQADEEVPLPRACTDDYVRSGFDRGHMCPSADNRWNPQAQQECFLMTNICPQLHALNDGDWRLLEEQCRRWAKDYGDIYIVCGPIQTRQRHRRIGQAKVTVPEAFFKVVVRLGQHPCGIGFVYRNDERRHAQAEYVNTIDQIERITGIDFFATLPSQTERQVEGSADLDEWQ